jgi:hypothetical protein
MDKLKELYETTKLSTDVIGSKVGMEGHKVRAWARALYDNEYRKARKKHCYRASKLGGKNPMFGKNGEAHHNKKDRCEDGKGYYIVLKPEWFTGREGSKHIFEHHAVYCKANNLTEMPKGMCIHHLDENKMNNSIGNLIMLSNGDHRRLHIWINLQNISGKETDV